MEFVFLNPAGTTLFVRNDLESGHWVEEQMNLTATFPFVADKLIQIGQRIAFRDPVTDILQVFEIVNVTNQEPEHFQQITAEHIVIAELSDEHINSQEITDKTASEALSTALTGTLWAVGTNTASGAQNGDFSRGSVWDAVNYIQQNWNVYITPRIVISSAGVITGRYLDIAPAEGTWRGLRLSVRKNMVDPSVTYDESEVYTALYGYGGNVEVAQTSGDDKTEELTFADVVWTATSDHPAKPSGQTYLEWPEKTALYGRNGRPRFGYYQNSSITDEETLLEKTWESLKQSSSPKVSVSGTVVDLYRLGYKDQPIRLHDTAIIEIEETGELLQKEIICNDVDLLDPTGTRIEAGDYIPNIVYINRETNKKASGGGGGGRAGDDQNELYDTFSDFEKMTDKFGSMIAMVVGRRNGDNYVKAGEIGLAINNSGGSGSYETTAYINADHVNISATQTAYTLAGEMERDANGKLIIKSGGGLWVQRQDQGTTVTVGVWDKGNLDGGIMVQQINGQSGGTITRITGSVIDIGDLVKIMNSDSSITISADRVDLTGYVTVSDLSATDAKIDNLTSGATTAQTLKTYLLSAATGFTYQTHSVSFHTVTIDNTTYHLLGY